MFRLYIFVILITPVYKIVPDNLKITLKVPEAISYIELLITLEWNVIA